MNHPVLIPTLWLCAALAPVAAQSPDSQDTAAPATKLGTALPTALVPVHQPAPDGFPTGELWAAGGDYKASFHDGPRFIPYLGAGYPRMQEVRWTTRSVRIGQTELLDGRVPALVPSDFRVEFHHGKVVEAYDVRAEGLEQTFVIAAAPDTGDLEVRGTLRGLRALPRAGGHGAVGLVDEQGRELITYGAATAVDALGRRWPMTTRCEDNEIRLRLDGAALAAAAFPLTVDPLIGVANSWSLGSTTTSEIAVVSPSGAGVVINAFTLWVAANDADLLLIAATPTAIFADLTVGTSTDQPALASVAATGKNVLAYRSLGGGISRLRVHVRQQNDTSLKTNSIGLLNAANVHDWRPSVGGTLHGSTGNHALIAFQREVTPTAAFAETSSSSVVAVLLNTGTASGQFGTQAVLGQGGSNDCERPSLNQVAEGGAAFSWMCVWQQYNNNITGDDWDLVGRRIDQSAGVSTGIWTSSVGTRHQLGPKVAGLNGRYAVLFATSDVSLQPTGTAGQDIRIERFDWAHGSSGPDPAGDQQAVILSQGTLAVREASALCADPSTRSHWGYLFRQIAPALQIGYSGRVGYRGQSVDGPLVTAYQQGASPCGLACSWERSGDHFHIRYGIVAAGTLTLYEEGLTHPFVDLSSTFGSGCMSINVAWAGPGVSRQNQRIGSELTRIEVSTVQPVQLLHFPLLSLGTADLPILDPAVGPNCRLLVDIVGPGYLGMLPMAIGQNVSWPLPLPEFLQSTTLHIQCWSLNPASGQFFSSQRRTVPLVR